MQEFFIEAETQLFIYRLHSNGNAGYSRVISELYRHCPKALSNQKLSKSYRSFLKDAEAIARKVKQTSMINCNNRKECSHQLYGNYYFIFYTGILTLSLTT